MFYRCLLMLIVALSVVGCETPDTIGLVTHRPYDKAFHKVTLHWSGRYTGSKTDVYLSRKQNGPHLEICGFYIGSSGIQQDLTAEWLRYAKITIGETEVVSGKFILQQPSLQNAESACVVTTTLYQANLLTQDIWLKGRKVTLSY